MRHAEDVVTMFGVESLDVELSASRRHVGADVTSQRHALARRARHHFVDDASSA